MIYNLNNTTSVASVAEREAAEMRSLLFLRTMFRPKVYVYVDGFNLFYGCLKKSCYKWLDLNKLIGFYFPKYEIKKIKYFTAIVQARKNDLDKPMRQQMYFRALATLPNLEIIYGTFLEKEVRSLVKDKDKDDRQQEANVWLDANNHKRLPLKGYNYLMINRTEEKGSDVNLGTHLIMDAYEKNFDVAIVISNDSDLAGPIKIVGKKLNLKVRLLNPYQKTNNKLREAVNDDKKVIRNAALQASQFPENLTDSIGDFHRPEDWVGKNI